MHVVLPSVVHSVHMHSLLMPVGKFDFNLRCVGSGVQGEERKMSLAVGSIGRYDFSHGPWYPIFHYSGRMPRYHISGV